MDILIVEDEGVVSMNAELHLTADGHNVIDSVNNGRAALKVLETSKPDLVLMDIVLHGDINGIETTRIINERFSDVPVAYMTAHRDEKTRQKIDSTKHVGVLYKPFGIWELEELIARTVKR